MMIITTFYYVLLIRFAALAIFSLQFYCCCLLFVFILFARFIYFCCVRLYAIFYVKLYNLTLLYEQKWIDDSLLFYLLKKKKSICTFLRSIWTIGSNVTYMCESRKINIFYEGMKSNYVSPKIITNDSILA